MATPCGSWRRTWRYVSNQRGSTAWSEAVRRCSQPCQKSTASASGERLSRKVQLSGAPPAFAGAGSGDGDYGDIGPGLADMRDLACELRLQRGLAALRHAGEVEGPEPLAFGVMEGDRSAGGLAPAGFVAPVLAGAQRHHHAVERDRGADRLGRDVLPVADRVHRLRLQGLPALMQAASEPLQGTRRRPHGAHLREERLRFPRRAVTHHHQPEPGGRARQVVVHQPQALVHRHKRCPLGAVAIARPAVGHRAERAHDRLRRRRHPEPALPAPLDPQRPVVQTLYPGPQNLAAQRVHALPNTKLRFLECGRAWCRSKRLATDRNQPRQRLQYPGRHAGKIDGRAGCRLRNCHGAAPVVGVFAETTSYPPSAGGAVPPAAPQPTGRDKIPTPKSRLSPIGPKGHRKRTQNLNKSNGYYRHTRLAPNAFGERRVPTPFRWSEAAQRTRPAAIDRRRLRAIRLSGALPLPRLGAPPS